MRVVNIPKGKGKFRTIYVPTKSERIKLRYMLKALNWIAKQECNPVVVHGFMPGKNQVTNAMPHCGYEITLNMDLQDFFDHVSERMVMPVIERYCRRAGRVVYPPIGQSKTPAPAFVSKWSTDRYQACFIRGRARQGLPTSPVLSNIAAIPLDKKIFALAQSHGAAYTRYADDLSISFNDPALVDLFKTEVYKQVDLMGFVVNRKKTHVQHAKGGRRIITGVGVDDRVHPTRRIKRKLRAAMHQGNTSSSDGLSEWMSLKVPGEYMETVIEQDRKLGAGWVS